MAALAGGIVMLLRDKITPIVKALEKYEGSVDPLEIYWIECADCAGDTIALLDATIVSSSIVSKFLLEKFNLGSELKLACGLTLNIKELAKKGLGWWVPPLNSDLVYVLLGLGVGLVAHDTVRPEWGEAIEILGKYIKPHYPAVYVEFFEDLVKRIMEGKPPVYALVLEGALTDEVFYKKYHNGWNAILGEKVVNGKRVPCTITEWFYKFCKGAVAVVGVGTCACYGGLPSNYAPDTYKFVLSYAASHSPSGAMGIFPDPLKGQPGFVKKYLEYAEKGILQEVWEWSEEEVKVFKDALVPYYNFIFKKVPPSISWKASSKIAVAVPGCPANGNAISLTLAYLLIKYLRIVIPELREIVDAVTELDEYWRPKYVAIKVKGEEIIRVPLFGYKLHAPLTIEGKYITGTGVKASLCAGCPRYKEYMASRLKAYPADGSGYCLYSVGCKGPVSTCPWNALGWIIDYDPVTGEFEFGEEAPGACTKTGAPCIACVMPGFSDAYEPFFEAAAAPRVAQGTLEALANVLIPAAAGVGAAFALREYVKKKRSEAESTTSSGQESSEEKTQKS